MHNGNYGEANIGTLFTRDLFYGFIVPALKELSDLHGVEDEQECNSVKKALEARKDEIELGEARAARLARARDEKDAKELTARSKRVLAGNAERLRSERKKEFKDELLALAKDKAAGNEDLAKLRELLGGKADFGSWLEETTFLQVFQN